jgi:hypothetical protein
MKPFLCALICVLLAPSFLRADAVDLSSERLDMLDQRGYFTPGFKKAVHDLVNARRALEQSQAETKKWNEELPALQKESMEDAAQVARIRAELAFYAHPENADFDALQHAMKSANVAPKERLMLAQAFIWAYPTDPRQAEAQEDLQQTQQLIAAQQGAVKETNAERLAARARLIQRALARQLSLPEWRSFLQDMSQEDLLKYLGRPQTQDADCWIYSGNWTTEPATKQPAGLRVNFNGTRVLSVVPEAP